MRVAAFINGATSTSFQLELSVNINQITSADITIFSLYDNSLSDADNDTKNYEMNFVPLGASSRFDVSAYKKLRNHLSDYDILHTHYNFTGSVARLASFGTNVRVVNTEHTDHNRLSDIQNVANMFTYPAVDAMVFNSKNTQQSIQSYEIPFLTKSDCYVAYNGVDTQRIQESCDLTPRSSLPSGPKIVTAARLVPVKNLTVLVSAMQLITEYFPDAQLIIIGDGPEKSHLQQLAIDLGVFQSTTFLGKLGREDVYAIMNQCDVFAVPSKHEGFCNAAVEAMYLRLPVVASDIAVLREVIGPYGQYADPESPKMFAQHIIDLLGSVELRNNVGVKLHNRVLQRYTIESSAKRYYQIYREVLSDS